MLQLHLLFTVTFQKLEEYEQEFRVTMTQTHRVRERNQRFGFFPQTLTQKCPRLNMFNIKIIEQKDRDLCET